MTYIQPKSLLKKFTCPHCEAISHITWDSRNTDFQRYGNEDKNNLRVGTCSNCSGHIICLKNKLLYPDSGLAPPCNQDAPTTVAELYEEAASISSKSPRGAAALLRLAIQVLCKELGEPGKDINLDIGNLVKRGLPDTVVKSLDIVRVTGNNAVHPGQIDVDNEEVVVNLFTLLNVIIEYMLTLPKKINNLHDSLPSTAKDQIKKRDK